MSTKDSYTAEEWALVSGAPILAGSFIAMSDPGITSLFGETSAMAKAMASQEVPADVKDLVAGIVGGLQDKSQEKIQMPELDEETRKDPAKAKAALLHEVKQGADTVAAKGGAAEAAAFSEYILSVALAVANAAKEGGFMGIGGKRISDEEQAALDQLKASLGI
jgi:hypothetical protein